jgi:hypothetical protein
VVDERPSEASQTGGRRNPDRSREAMDKAVGYVASVLGLLVVIASMPTQSKTGVLAMTGMVLGVFGYLLGARWLGGTVIVVSTAAILLWFLA